MCESNDMNNFKADSHRKKERIISLYLNFQSSVHILNSENPQSVTEKFEKISLWIFYCMDLCIVFRVTTGHSVMNSVQVGVE